MFSIKIECNSITSIRSFQFIHLTRKIQWTTQSEHKIIDFVNAIDFIHHINVQLENAFSAVNFNVVISY